MPSQPIKSSKSSTPLSSALAQTTFIAVALGMVAYSIFEYFTNRQLGLDDFLQHHVLPAFIISLTVWLALFLQLRQKFAHSIKLIINHTYQMGKGRFAPLQLNSKIKEISMMVDSSNSMAQSLKEGLAKAIDDLVKLREDLNQVIEHSQIKSENFLPILLDLKQLEKHLLATVAHDVTTSHQKHSTISGHISPTA